jgi:hypothetical protein
MGYAVPESGASRACVRICSYCPDKKEAEDEAERANHDMTHSICPECYNKQLAKLLGEQAA